MKKILKVIIMPTYLYLRWLLVTIKIIRQNPTIKIGQRASIMNSKIGRYNHFAKNTSFSNSEIGDYSYLAQNAKVRNTKIGKFTCIGANVQIGLADHPIDTFVSIHPVFYSAAKQVGVSFVSKNYFDEYPNTVTIGNDVWIGGNVTIIGNITIGNGAVLASGAIVTKDVEPYTIVAGIPARVIKKRFSEDTISFLQTFRWWNKPDKWLKENTLSLHNVEKFKIANKS